MQVNDTFGASASLGAASTLGGHTTTLSLATKTKRTPSAVMLMEDLKEGQRVIGWRLELSDGTAAGEWAAVANGTSIGHKHIVMPLDSTLVSASSGVICRHWWPR